MCGNENFHNFKEKLILSEKLFLHSLHFFFFLTRWLFLSHSLISSQERKADVFVRTNTIIFFSFIGEKRSYDRINCLLKTRFNIDNWMAYRLMTMSTIYLYIFFWKKNSLTFDLFFYFLISNAEKKMWKRTRKSFFVFLT